MKNNISYYPHKVVSHGHWKFKALRKKFGWAGEGKFWALHNFICDSEDCCLLLEDEEKFLSIAADIDLSPEELHVFLDFLLTKCKLLIKQENKITTETAQETLAEVMAKRTYQRNWKNKKSSIETGNSSIEKTFSNIETKESNIDFEQSKVKRSKVNNDDVVIAPPIAGFRDIEKLKEIVWNDKMYVSLICAQSIPEDAVLKWLTAFNRYLVYVNKTIRQESDYRQHFTNWLTKIPNFRTMNPDDYSPVKDHKAPTSKEDDKFKKILNAKK